MSKININNLLLGFVGFILALCLLLALMTNKPVEGFQNDSDEVDAEIIRNMRSELDGKSNEELKSIVSKLKNRLVNYGFLPDTSNFVRKTELGLGEGKCKVANAEDRDLYIAKSSVPAPGPRVDLSQYVKKTSIPPEKVCPPQKEIDYSAYVKKSSLPPNKECPPCIAPKVKVSAGLCKKCPPCPACPPPPRCPELKCPEPQPCPEPRECPAPAPCPTLGQQKTCDEIRYIKVPTVITKVIKVDQNGKVLSKSVETDTPTIEDEDLATETTQPAPTQALSMVINQPQTTKGSCILPTHPPEDYKITTTQPQTTKAKTCELSNLNSEFSNYGVYGYNV